MNKTLEERVKTLSELERIKHRAGVYIGNINPETKPCFVLDEIDGFFKSKDIEYTAGILKICDEVLSNSVDEYIETNYNKSLLPKSKQKNFHTVTEIKVDITEDGLVTIFDNGGIPVEFHKVNKCYLPQMLFGEIGTGSNYNDGKNEKRTKLGLNGLGAKLANIFSTKFSIDTCDGVSRYQQVWENGLIDVYEPLIITKSKKVFKKKSFVDIGKKTERQINVNFKNAPIGDRGTTVQFKIDMKYFSENDISYGIIKLLERKCILACASNIGLKITFNGKVYQFKNFTEYTSMYYNDGIITGKINEWEYALLTKSSVNGGGNVFGIVNGGECSKGTHVSMANNLIRTHVKNYMKKKFKMDFTNDNISKQYDLFLSCTVNKPVYEHQTKEKLVTKPNNFDGYASGEQKFLPKTFKEIEESSIIENLKILFESNKNSADTKTLKKQDSENKKKSPRSIAKLLDATSTRGRDKCTLWLFEGQSAANTFRGVRNPKLDGSYTLKGKIKNTWGLSKGKLSANSEINDIAMALGARYDGKHDVNKLRFGKIVIAVDADVDGISINAQLLTFFWCVFPELILNGMVYLLNSPLYKLYKGKQVKYIYSVDEFEKTNKKGWNVEYFKGLGSLGDDEYHEMISNPRLIQFVADEETEESIKLWMQPSEQDKQAPNRRKAAMESLKTSWTK